MSTGTNTSYFNMIKQFMQTANVFENLSEYKRRLNGIIRSQIKSRENHPDPEDEMWQSDAAFKSAMCDYILKKNCTNFCNSARSYNERNMVIKLMNDQNVEGFFGCMINDSSLSYTDKLMKVTGMSFDSRLESNQPETSPKNDNVTGFPPGTVTAYGQFNTSESDKQTNDIMSIEMLKQQKLKDFEDELLRKELELTKLKKELDEHAAKNKYDIIDQLAKIQKNRDTYDKNVLEYHADRKELETNQKQFAADKMSHNADLDDKTRVLDNLRKSLNKREAELNIRAKKLEVYEKAHDRRSKDLDSLTEKLKNDEVEIARLKKESEDTNKFLATAKESSEIIKASLKKKVAEFAKAAKNHNDKVMKYREDIAQHIKDANELAVNQDKVAEFDNEVRAREAKVAEFDNEVRAREAKVAEFDNEVRAREAKVAEFEATKTKKFMELSEAVQNHNDKVMKYREDIAQHMKDANELAVKQAKYYEDKDKLSQIKKDLKIREKKIAKFEAAEAKKAEIEAKRIEDDMKIQYKKIAEEIAENQRRNDEAVKAAAEEAAKKEEEAAAEEAAKKEEEAKGWFFS